jgi:pimeloyl-ACP methyl ester carboxylesterase
MKTKLGKGLLFLLSFSLLTGILAGCTEKVVEQKEEEKYTVNETMVPGLDSGIELYVKEKKSKDKEAFKGEEVVLFLEPFGVPTADAFDVKGYSWMEDLADKGYDTWAMDFRNFGKSTRTEEMNKPATESEPLVRFTDAVKDVHAVVEHIKKTRNVEKVNIVGWSWGTVVGMQYAIEHQDNVNKLVLYGGMYAFQLPQMTTTMESSPGVLKPQPAYQLAEYNMTRHHWAQQMAGKDLVEPGVMEEVGRVFLAADTTSKDRDPISIRRAWGPMIDLYQIWSGKPVLDASKITVPTLVIRGDGDFFADPGLVNALTGVKEKKDVVIKDATHWVLYEKNRNQLLTETYEFLK